MEKLSLKQPKLLSFYKKIVPINKKRQQIKPLLNNFLVFQKDITLQIKYPKHKRQLLNSRHKTLSNQHSLFSNKPKPKIGRPRADEFSKEKLITKYKKLFKWLLINDNLSWCSYCKKYAEFYKMARFKRINDNTLVFDGSTKFKKDIFTKHQDRDLHKKAILEFGEEKERLFYIDKVQKTEGKNVHNLIKTMRQNEPNPVLLAQFKVVYFAAKNDLAISLAPKIYDLLNSIGLEKIDHYKDRHDVTEMLGYISDKIKCDLIQEFTFCRSIGICIDETTNIRNQKVLTINAKYFYQGHKKFKLLKILEIENGEAKTLFKALKSTLESYQIADRVTHFALMGLLLYCLLGRAFLDY